jgi:hypothetical protein
MNHLDPSALAHMITQERIREANHQRLVRELRPARASTGSATATATRTAQRPSRLRSLVHFRHAYS